ncbi:MAG: hypothetical protein ACRD06_06230 [Terriglobia bacterium]
MTAARGRPDRVQTPLNSDSMDKKVLKVGHAEERKTIGVRQQKNLVRCRSAYVRRDLGGLAKLCLPRLLDGLDGIDAGKVFCRYKLKE